METSLKSALRQAGRLAGEILFETVWPTRCAICDMPGEDVLCPRCAAALSYIDLCLACPICGAPYGRVQCTECNDVMLAGLGLDALPIDGMTSVLALDEATRRMIVTYKDADERRLCAIMAQMMARYINPDLIRKGCVITYVPDTLAAVRRRGFDHAQEMAKTLGDQTGLETVRLLEQPRTIDQRKLGRRERIQNMMGAMKVCSDAQTPPAILLIDDVCTTGATIFGAARALKEAGAAYVYALTLGRAFG